MNRLLNVESLSIIKEGKFRSVIINDFDFHIDVGECVAFYGPSGIGKSLTALSLLGLLPTYLHLSISGKLAYFGQCYELNKPKSLAKLRGSHLSLVQQEAQGALNPLRTCGDQLIDVLLAHSEMSKNQAKDMALKWLSKVQLDDSARVFQSYPHQLSGGQKQRILICLAFLCPSELVIFDEPTASLDSITSIKIQELIADLQRTENRSFLLISHDARLISNLAQRTYNFYSSHEILETDSILRVSTHESLVRATSPELTKEVKPARVMMSDVSYNYGLKKRRLFGRGSAGFQALKHVSCTLSRGEAIGLIGRSGSGKSTFAKLLVRLLRPSSGKITLEGQDIFGLVWKSKKEFNSKVQMIFQDPSSALSPRMKVSDHLLELVSHFRPDILLTKPDLVDDLLNYYRLPLDFKGRYPHELSGGQRQRILLAKVLAIEPDLLICDESLSALDAKNKELIYVKLKALKDQGMTQLYISHDAFLLQNICDTIVVMNRGVVEEITPADRFLIMPQSEEGKKLLDAMK